MKLRYVGEVEGQVNSLGVRVSHGDVIDSSVWGEREEFFVQKALKTDNWIRHNPISRTSLNWFERLMRTLRGN